MDLKKEIGYLKFVAIDNSLTDSNILEDFDRIDFQPFTIEEVSFYYSAIGFNWLLGLMKNKQLINQKNKPISENELKKHFKEYGKGFREGFFNYLDNTKDEIKLFKNNDKVFINKIFSKVQNAVNVSCLPLKLINSEKPKADRLYMIIENSLFNSGVIDGEIYKAWMIVAEYNTMFIKRWAKEHEIVENSMETTVFNIDLSDSKANEKIIMLHKLGVIDFLIQLEPFNTSTNSLASAISGITGEKQTTIQSYLNPLISNSVDQKNNPFNSPKAVTKTNQKLISIGFPISK